MAIVPLSGTDIRLLSGVPFSNDYKNSRWFDSLSEQTTYFLAKPVTYSYSEHNFQRQNGKTFIKVMKSVDELYNVNYLMFRNTAYNNKWFYAFVTELEYVQKNTTYVHFQIDVLQTWLTDMNFLPSMVVREHCPLWNSDGTPVINTVDEGLHYGTDYDVLKIDNYLPYDDVLFLVIVSKSLLHGTNAKKITPTLNGLPQPLSYYIHPFRLDGTSPTVNIAGSDVSISSITDMLRNIFTQADAVNNVVSLYVTEYLGFDVQYASGAISLPDVVAEVAPISDNTNPNINTIHLKQMVGYTEQTKVYPDKYSGYGSVTESKLLMYPYALTILDDFKGNRSVIKNEYIHQNDLSISVKGSMGVNNKTAYTVNDYLVKTNLNYSLIASLEQAIINNSPNDVPILSDYLSAYLQGNRNSIENQKNSIMFNGVMGGIGNAIGGIASGASGSPAGLASAITGIGSGMGNAVLQLQGLQAKQQDIANLPPQMVKMGGNTAFDYGNSIRGVYIIKKQILPEYRTKLTDFFNMFGYKLNEIKVPNFHTRRYWNYVQTASCNITGNFNNADLQELKQVFDNGITLWHTDAVGSYGYANEVL